MGLWGAAGVMAGINVWVACTLSGGVLGSRLGGTEGGGIGGGLVSRRGAWRACGFTGGILDGEMVLRAPGLQLLATTVSSSSSSLVRMWSGLLMRIWH
jgi:hypothetical protein